ncbi:Vacuolar iron transporter Ccc1 [Venustampulla echinocandica]|uniref:Vacuolar iron transporter Ccc1 n=1 Tax=Venustampulla echinocandica TaxID=2656787 RepID=A0A370TAT7_9HELO|nr:Vacuolar iron transporter Ccc1 [Venustampulla echinocandica]RDL31037.1 Vacuolar iron transporter Ccc1 [Venustampulla echinocandica]
MARSKSPYLTRFLSDFTLGFSDGLTVPFALTAGLSSLGKADTVIYAGLAELCAGSISMGIGGYLSALDEVPSSKGYSDELRGHGDEAELRGIFHDASSRSSTINTSDDINEKDDQESSEDLIRYHLEPLALPNIKVLEILATLRNRPGGVGHAVLSLQQHNAAAETPFDQLPIVPVSSGLSISLGYAIGGIIPLFPYFFASTVGRGLQWSIAMFLMALIAFGTGKSWVLRGEERTLKRSLWEGFQMLILGSVAAAASVICVNLVGGNAKSLNEEG